MSLEQTPNYDNLLDPGIREPSDRERMLFSPTEVPEPPTEYNYDDLLNPDIQMAGSVEAAAVRPKPRQVTAETEAEALTVISDASSHDAELSHLLTQYANDLGLNPKDLPKALRTNADLRLAVGLHLTDKIERLSSQLPRRIAVNTEKNPNGGGYSELGRLTSQEYAALLALGSYSSGSFSSIREKNDPITYDPNIDDGLGQHRWAARRILS